MPGAKIIQDPLDPVDAGRRMAAQDAAADDVGRALEDPRLAFGIEPHVVVGVDERHVDGQVGQHQAICCGVRAPVCRGMGCCR